MKKRFLGILPSISILDSTSKWDSIIKRTKYANLHWRNGFIHGNYIFRYKETLFERVEYNDRHFPVSPSFEPFSIIAEWEKMCLFFLRRLISDRESCISFYIPLYIHHHLKNLDYFLGQYFIRTRAKFNESTKKKNQIPHIHSQINF